jgi:MFS family permease
VSGQQQARPPVLPISGLGLLTIVAYGACYYAYGVLIQPIGADTHWPDAALGAIFSAILVISGVLGAMAGRLLDRRGPRRVFLLAAVAGAVGMLAASAQSALLPFAITYAGGCGLVGALGFYHITQAAAARAAPAAPARAIIWLTLFGALSSPVYLPLTAWLVQSAGWRDTIRIQAGTVLAAFLLAAVLVKNPGGSWPGRPGQDGRGAPGRMAEPARAHVAPLRPDRRHSSRRPHLVPGPGHRQGRAAAGNRGGGRRFPRPGPTGRTASAHRTDQQIRSAQHPRPGLRGQRRRHLAALCGRHTTASAAAQPLRWRLDRRDLHPAGHLRHELINPRHLGMLLGIQQAVFAIGGAAGPAAAAALLGATGSYTPAITIITAGFAAAAGILLLARTRNQTAARFPCGSGHPLSGDGS